MKNIFYTPKSLSQYDIVVEKLKLDLRELVWCNPDETEVLEYVTELINQITEAESYNGMSIGLSNSSIIVTSCDDIDRCLALKLDTSESYPMEEYIMYVITPSQIALSILAFSIMKYESIRKIDGIFGIINGLMNTSMLTQFNGHGFDWIRGIIDSLKIMTEGHLHEFIQIYPDVNDNFKKCYEQKMEFVLTDLYSGKVKGDFGESYTKEADEVAYLTERVFFTEEI